MEVLGDNLKKSCSKNCYTVEFNCGLCNHKDNNNAYKYVAGCRGVGVKIKKSCRGNCNGGINCLCNHK